MLLVLLLLLRSNTFQVRVAAAVALRAFMIIDEVDLAPWSEP